MVSYNTMAILAFAASATVRAVNAAAVGATMSTLRTTTTMTGTSSATAAASVAKPGSGNGTIQHSSDDLDGFYVHVTGSDGQLTSIYMGIFHGDPVLAANETEMIANTRRSGGTQGGITCNNQYGLNFNDVNQAEQGMEAAFQYGGSFYQSPWTYKVGTAVAYGCNYGNGQEVAGPWLSAQFANIATTCGSAGPGYVSYPDWKAQYGIDSTSVSLC
jgi:hypothetical protein